MEEGIALLAVSKAYTMKILKISYKSFVSVSVNQDYKE